MLKIFSQKITYTFIPLILVIILINPSCKKYNNAIQIRQLDTLIQWNNNAKNMLIIDVQAIKLRTDSMKIKINALDSNTKITPDIQFKSDLVIYKGLLTRYIYFLNNYPEIEIDNSENSIFLNDLKLKIIDNKNSVNKNELDSQLGSKEKIIQAHFIKVKELVETVFSMEEMYQRTNNRINQVYQNLKTQNTKKQ